MSSDQENDETQPLLEGQNTPCQLLRTQSRKRWLIAGLVGLAVLIMIIVIAIIASIHHEGK